MLHIFRLIKFSVHGVRFKKKICSTIFQTLIIHETSCYEDDITLHILKEKDVYFKGTFIVHLI